MSSKELQLSSGALVERSESAQPGRVTQSLSNIVASPPDSQGRIKLTAIATTVTRSQQQSETIIQENADGQVQQKQRSQAKAVRVERAQHPDGTQTTKIQQEHHVRQTATNPTRQQQQQQATHKLVQHTGQENALVPANNAVSPAQCEQSALVPFESQTSQNMHEADNREVSLPLETSALTTVRQGFDQGIDVAKLHANLALTEKHQNKEDISQANEGLFQIIDQYRQEERTPVIRSEVTTHKRHLLHQAIRQLYLAPEAKRDYTLRIGKRNEENDEDTGRLRYDFSSFEKCMNVFCQACYVDVPVPFCHQRNPTTGEREQSIFTKNMLKPPILRKARNVGLNLLQHMMFPLVGPGWRIVWIIFELLFVIASAGLSIASYVTGSRYIFNLVHLVLISVSTALAIFDGCYFLPKSVKLWIRYRKAKQQEKNGGMDLQKYLPNNEQDESQSENSACCKYNCCNCFDKFSDLARIFVTEVLVVSLLICDIFDFVVHLPTYSGNFESIVSGILFGLGITGLLMFVYFVKIAIISKKVHFIKKARTGFVSNRQPLEEAGYEFKKVCNYEFTIQFAFFLHVIGQIIVQIFMLIAVGQVIFTQNTHFYHSRNRDMTISASPELWYMFVAATFVPVFGFFTFFVVNNFWVQQFSISFCLDLIRALKMPGAEEFFNLKSISRLGVMQKIERSFPFKDLENQYKDLRKKRDSPKVTYPFQSPTMVFICALYLAAQLGFVSCVILGQFSTGNNMNSGSGAEYDGFFTLFLIGSIYFALPLAFIINIHAFAVPLFWIFFIILLIIFLPIVLFCTILAELNKLTNNG